MLCRKFWKGMVIKMKTNTIKLAQDLEVPIKCDLYVLQKIQDKYGTILEFEKQLLGICDVIEKSETDDETKSIGRTEPKPETIIFGLMSMVQEGYAVNRMEMPYTDERELIAMVTRDYRTLASAIHDEFRDCFKTKK